jgi:hypothetical protein
MKMPRWLRRPLTPPPELLELNMTPGKVDVVMQHPAFTYFAQDVIEMFFEAGAENFFDVTCWHPEHGAFTITVQRMNGKPAGQVVAELKARIAELEEERTR